MAFTKTLALYGVNIHFLKYLYLGLSKISLYFLSYFSIFFTISGFSNISKILLSQNILLYSISDKSSDNSKSSNNTSKKLKKFIHFLLKSFKIILSSNFGTFDFDCSFFINLSLAFVIQINILSYSSLSSLFTKSDEISLGSKFKSIDFIGNVISIFI
jgi:hypothetical protein